jgi:FKBP-type peptidyl-prolyl cis-trans isomerase (trigger factor)
MDACEVSEVPDSLVETYKEEINKNAQSYAEAYGVELEDFITSYMGMDMDEFNSQVEESAKSAAEENLVTRAIAKKADLEVTEDEMNSRAEAEYAEYQYESAEAFLEDVGEFTYQQYLLQEKVEDYLMGIVKFVEGEEVNIQSYYYGDSDEDESEVDEDSEDVIEIDGEDEESDEVLSDEEASDEEETDEEASENEGESDDTASEDGAEDEEAEE